MSDYSKKELCDMSLDEYINGLKKRMADKPFPNSNPKRKKILYDELKSSEDNSDNKVININIAFNVNETDSKNVNVNEEIQSIRRKLMGNDLRHKIRSTQNLVNIPKKLPNRQSVIINHGKNLRIDNVMKPSPIKANLLKNKIETKTDLPSTSQKVYHPNKKFGTYYDSVGKYDGTYKFFNEDVVTNAKPSITSITNFNKKIDRLKPPPALTLKENDDHLPLKLESQFKADDLKLKETYESDDDYCYDIIEKKSYKNNVNHIIPKHEIDLLPTPPVKCRVNAEKFQKPKYSESKIIGKKIIDPKYLK